MHASFAYKLSRNHHAMLQGGQASGAIDGSADESSQASGSSAAAAAASASGQQALQQAYCDPEAHMAYLRDASLIKAWQQALKQLGPEHIQGKTVVDLGCGPGLLGLMCAQVGATSSHLMGGKLVGGPGTITTCCVGPKRLLHLSCCKTTALPHAIKRHTAPQQPRGPIQGGTADTCSSWPTRWNPLITCAGGSEAGGGSREQPCNGGCGSTGGGGQRGGRHGQRGQR